MSSCYVLVKAGTGRGVNRVIGSGLGLIGSGLLGFESIGLRVVGLGPSAFMGKFQQSGYKLGTRRIAKSKSY
ncbi:hypothetical protein CTI12_AA126120 [Artemisia annua]|uniref:Uncharacterized protein n=1 Tax=Artemisia annua TaxID=35608 RepID=A0A2U1NNV9_ARTAN|nr:hypothetical protein CTI12_AA126120 [Artemisia annua]